MSAREIRDKFAANARRALDPERIAALEERVLSLEALPNVSTLMDLAAVKEPSHV